jgi:hypothetical protein
MKVAAVLCALFLVACTPDRVEVSDPSPDPSQSSVARGTLPPSGDQSTPMPLPSGSGESTPLPLPRVEVPDVVGLDWSHTVTALDGAGLELRPNAPHPGSRCDGGSCRRYYVVLGQNPPPRSFVDEGTEVEVFFTWDLDSFSRVHN